MLDFLQTPPFLQLGIQVFLSVSSVTFSISHKNPVKCSGHWHSKPTDPSIRLQCPRFLHGLYSQGSISFSHLLPVRLCGHLQV